MVFVGVMEQKPRNYKIFRNCLIKLYFIVSPTIKSKLSHFFNCCPIHRLSVKTNKMNIKLHDFDPNCSNCFIKHYSDSLSCLPWFSFRKNVKNILITHFILFSLWETILADFLNWTTLNNGIHPSRALFNTSLVS